MKKLLANKLSKKDKLELSKMFPKIPKVRKCKNGKI